MISGIVVGLIAVVFMLGIVFINHKLINTAFGKQHQPLKHVPGGYAQVALKNGNALTGRIISENGRIVGVYSTTPISMGFIPIAEDEISYIVELTGTEFNDIQIETDCRRELQMQSRTRYHDVWQQYQESKQDDSLYGDLSILAVLFQQPGTPVPSRIVQPGKNVVKLNTLGKRGN